MNITNYIESGIIERYLLGLTTPEQEEELLFLRKRHPLLDLEIRVREYQIEDRLQHEAVPPPAVLRDRILQRIEPGSGRHQNGAWTSYNSYEHTNTNRTTWHIPVEPFWNRRISVSVWWRCVVIVLVIFNMVLLASTWYFYHHAAQLEEVLIHLKAPSVNAFTYPAH
ncbi:hypothetical protein ACDQ55_04395 [Chitinophaga sp. 30R24]|uniref:hypothetical protein n=1 Tax=Chitinophaga sp. 30R24 TaxID=3248838 RepID=UPI003B8EB246